jgi:hypothetical protein
MSKSLKNLFISMEEEGNDVNQTTLEVSADNTMEEEVAEVTEAGIEVIEAEDDVEELYEIAEGLESIVASLESAIEDGGLDTQAAVFMQHAVDGYTTRVGMEATAIVPSLESFGGASGKAAATTISLEGIKETIKKIWQAIKNAIAKAIAAVKNFFAKIFGGVKKLKERSKALRSEVKKLGNKKVKTDAKLKVPGANTLRFNKKVDAKSIATGMDKLVQALEKKELTQSAITYYDQIATVLDKGEELAKDGEEKFMAALAKGKESIASMKSVISLGLMSGDATLEVVKTSEEGIETVGIPTLTKGKGGDIEEGKEESVPKADELEAILRGVDKVIKAIESKDGIVKNIITARDRAIKAGDKLAQKAADGKIDRYIKGAKVQVAMRMAARDAVRPVTQLSQHGFSVARAGLAYVDRAIKLYEEDK